MQLLRSWFIPDLVTVSEGNSTHHYRKKHIRHLLQAREVKKHVRPHGDEMPCIIKMIRIAPRALDFHDNLPYSMKFLVDAIADILIPGKPLGQADNDPRLQWTYGQEKGKPKEYSVRIEVWKE